MYHLAWGVKLQTVSVSPGVGDGQPAGLQRDVVDLAVGQQVVGAGRDLLPVLQPLDGGLGVSTCVARHHHCAVL